MQTMPLHAARRQAEHLPELLRLVLAETAAAHPADRFLAGYYRAHREFGGRDRRFFSGMIFAWFRWRGWLPAPEPLAETGLAAAAMLDGLPPHPALDCLAERAGLPPPSAAPAGRPLAERAAQLQQYLQLADCPAPAALAPKWTAEYLFYPAGTPPAGHFQACLEAFQVRPATWVRLDSHPPRASPALPPGARAHAALPRAAALPNTWPPDYNPASVQYLEVQDLASQAVGIVCAPQPNERWWDACAGAGGKTLHLADLLAGSGEVWATDARPAMLAALQKRRPKHAPAKIHCRPWQGGPAGRPAGMFDGVLVDAPCSGLGTWNRNPDARWRMDASAIPASAAAQARLLRAAAEKVRPGGCLVYAVCTLTAMETVEVAADFTADCPDFALQPVVHPLTGQPTDGRVWVWPWQDACNGMFIARWRRQS